MSQKIKGEEYNGLDLEVTDGFYKRSFNTMLIQARMEESKHEKDEQEAKVMETSHMVYGFLLYRHFSMVIHYIMNGNSNKKYLQRTQYVPGTSPSV